MILGLSTYFNGIYMKRLTFGALCALSLVACGGQNHDAAPANEPAAAPPQALSSGIDTANFDQSVRPQDDLFRYVNGHWLDTTEIPADKSNYGAFSELADQAEKDLRAIIEESADKADKTDGSNEQKVGDLYDSFMDEAALEAKGAEPLKDELAAIDSIDDKAQLPAAFAQLSKLGVRTPMGFYINQDAKDSTQYIAWFAQTGLGLPDRDYYLSDDAKFVAIREAYVAHMSTMLSGIGIDDAQTAAEQILAFETQLATTQWTRVESRDDDKTYNPYEVAKLAELTPGLDWSGYLDAAGIDSDRVIVMQPSAYEGMAKLIAETPMPQIRSYLKWHLLTAYAPYLSKTFVDEDFAFYGKTLRGIEELSPRWKRGVGTVEDALGEVVGKIYVERHFPPEAKARMEKLVDNLKLAYRESISDIDWMSEETKAKALEKLSKFTTKIGYPDKWKDYDALKIKAGDLVGNVMQANTFAFQRDVDKLGQPIDRDEWHMTPQTVNAYYNPSMNEIVFPAAILQPPFFNFEAEDAVNYGGIGAVIGHEIGHGFDDQGSKYDGDGNLKSWWTDADREKFETRTKALISQYDAYCPLEGQCVQGALTIGENIGDLGGLSIGYKAYHLALGEESGPEIDGFSADQRVFMGWAQVWRRKYREAELLNRLKTDPHSPSEFRCNGVAKNVDAFYKAFDVKPSDALYLPPEQRVTIW